MKRYLIERNISGVGSLNAQQLKNAAATSNAALAKLAGHAQWVQSYVVNDKTDGKNGVRLSCPGFSGHF